MSLRAVDNSIALITDRGKVRYCPGPWGRQAWCRSRFASVDEGVRLPPASTSSCYNLPVGYTGEQKRQYDLAWCAARRDRAIEMLGGHCVRCGSSELLEIDHIDPATKDPRMKNGGTQGFVWTWAWSWLETELAKCQLLCDECHKRKTKEERPEIPHGTHTKYVYHACRCSECRAAHARVNAKYR